MWKEQHCLYTKIRPPKHKTAKLIKNINFEKEVVRRSEATISCISKNSWPQIGGCTKYECLERDRTKTSFSYDSVRSHSIVFFTETALQNYWRCKSTLSNLFRFTSKVESDETNTKRKGMIYHISSNLRFHWFLKISFQGMHFRMRNSSPEKQFIFRWDWFSSLETISPFNCEKKWAKWLPHEK